MEMWRIRRVTRCESKPVNNNVFVVDTSVILILCIYDDDLILKETLISVFTHSFHLVKLALIIYAIFLYICKIIHDI